MRPVTQNGNTKADNAASQPSAFSASTTAVQLSEGRWSVRGSSVLLYHRKMGELSHSWAGNVVELLGGGTHAAAAAAAIVV